jgi:hypothetical protein
MLTSFQVAVGGYITEYGDLLCEECFDRADTYAKPMSNYELDEWQSSEGYGHDWRYDHDDDEDGVLVQRADESMDDFDTRVNEYHEECEPALLDVNGHELREAYHYHREKEE